MNKKAIAWLIWLVGTIVMVTWMTNLMRSDDATGAPAMIDRTMFIPGKTTAGHYQIELACNVCHTPGHGVRQDACMQCHESELAAAADSHPPRKFAPLDKLHLTERLDARYCITCHVEHEPTMTRAVGVTMPLDYCAHCHQSIGDERPSHAGLSFQSCATVGCHNFHDNRALNEPFLTAHLDDADHLAVQRVPLRGGSDTAHKHVAGSATPLTEDDHDAPPEAVIEAELMRAWVGTTHARSGVNCTDCHTAPAKPGQSEAPSRVAGSPSAWLDTPTHDACRRCHTAEVDGFLTGRHGMRLVQGMSPMTPAMARQPMHAGSAHRSLTCTSCHDDHAFDTRFAAFDACVQCHDDAHTRAYAASPHARLWRDELAGRAPAGSGVSCATCHLPRITTRVGDIDVVTVQHNQNDNLRPNEKMLHNVCIHCHGVGFALDALADVELIRSNFSASPDTHVESLDMIRAKLADIERKRAARKPADN